MSSKKYKFTYEQHSSGIFKRIKALRNFSDVKKGDIGGWIRCEKNLSHSGDAWVYDNAWVSGDAIVNGNARVSGNARLSGNARVGDDARVSGNAIVSGDTRIYGDAFIYSDESMYINESCNNEVIYNGHKSRYLTLIYNELRKITSL